MKYLLLLLCLSSFVFANKAMSERMQSVVDEVTQLRENYEDISRKHSICEEELKRQEKAMSKISHNEGFDYEAFEKNREKLANLETEYKEYENLCEKSQLEKSTWIESLKLELKTSQEKNKTLKDKNNKLIQSNALAKNAKTKSEDTSSIISLKEKNKTLENELSILQKEAKSLQKEILSLKTEIDSLKESKQTKIKQKPEVRVIKEIKTKKVYVSGCKDENPFPKLMMKEATRVRLLNVEPKKIIEEASTEELKTEKSYTYRMRIEAKIYNGINGDFIEAWEEKTSFTGNLSQDGWIMITGYFVEKKWVKAKAEMWVKAEDTIKR